MMSEMSDFFGPTAMWYLGWIFVLAKVAGAVWAAAGVVFVWCKAWKQADNYANQAKLLRFERQLRDEAIRCRHMFATLDAVGFGIEVALATLALVLIGVHPAAIVFIDLMVSATVTFWITKKYIALLPNPHRLILGGFRASRDH